MAALPLSAWSLLDGLPPAVRFADAIPPVPVAAAAGDLDARWGEAGADQLIAAYTRIALTARCCWASSGEAAARGCSPR